MALEKKSKEQKNSRSVYQMDVTLRGNERIRHMQ